MYEGLETNLPHTLMQYSDTPFPPSTQLFPTRETVLRYLETYACDVMDMIRFDHRVVDVSACGGDGWDVVTESTVGDENYYRVERFDAVVVANGHCEWPLLPDVEGLDAWCREVPGSVHHSVGYKNAEAFVDKVSRYLVAPCLSSITVGGIPFFPQRLLKKPVSSVSSL